MVSGISIPLKVQALIEYSLEKDINLEIFVASDSKISLSFLYYDYGVKSLIIA